MISYMGACCEVFSQRKVEKRGSSVEIAKSIDTDTGKADKRLDLTCKVLTKDRAYPASPGLSVRKAYTAVLLIDRFDG